VFLHCTEPRFVSSAEMCAGDIPSSSDTEISGPWLACGTGVAMDASAMDARATSIMIYFDYE
jgi:hypothetical protein